MRYGCCVNMIATMPDKIGVEWVEDLYESGYDYIELPLAQMMDMDNSAFSKLVNRVNHSGIRCETCNNFFPTSIRLTGMEVDEKRIREYVEKAMERANLLGSEIIVFGSSGAKNVPVGFSYYEAWNQIVKVLRIIDHVAIRAGIHVAIEPLNKQESNIINRLSEALVLAKEVDGKNIGVLVDYYHMEMENEDPAIIQLAGKWIKHVHLAQKLGRTFPIESNYEQYKLFISNLKSCGYDLRVSIESYSQDYKSDIKRSILMMKKI